MRTHFHLVALTGLLAAVGCSNGGPCSKNSDCPSGQLCDPVGLQCVGASTLEGGTPTTGGASTPRSSSLGSTGASTSATSSNEAETTTGSTSGGSTGHGTGSPRSSGSTSGGATTTGGGAAASASTGSTSSGGAPPLDGGVVTDDDGNVYPTITIGTQTWMAENLRTTTLSDGTPIPFLADAGTWTGASTPGYAWTNGDATTTDRFGYLYNGYAVQTGTLAPAGWHVATSADWSTLATTLGGVPVAGGALKEAGYADWQSPNTGATNSSGFTALAGGYRDDTGAFQDFYAAGGWWSSTSGGAGNATFYFTDHINSYENSGTDSFTYGFSVRCVAN